MEPYFLKSVLGAKGLYHNGSTDRVDMLDMSCKIRKVLNVVTVSIS